MFNIALKRHQVGLSQSKLAHEAGVSLPTIQNLEAGKGNPTLDVLEKVARALGESIEWLTPPIDWEEGSWLGIPLLGGKRRFTGFPHPDRLVHFLRRTFQNLKTVPLQERELQALGALLMALKQHFHRFYRDRVKSEVAEEILSRVEDDPKVLKLRRIALSRLAEYL